MWKTRESRNTWLIRKMSLMSNLKKEGEQNAGI